MWQGHYPRIYDREIPAQRWLADYITTYLQRDVRQITQITNLNTFTAFLKLCAGHTGQEVNFSRLGNDIGINYNTARSWLSVLETSWLGITLPAWSNNIRKQVIKAPKWHFIDTGSATGDINSWLVYGGNDSYQRQGVRVAGWNKLTSEFSNTAATPLYSSNGSLPEQKFLR